MKCKSIRESLQDRRVNIKDISSSFYKHHLKKSAYLVEKLVLSVTLTGHRGCVNTILFSEDGNNVFTGSDDTFVHIYDVDTGKLRTKLRTKHTNNIFYVKDLPYSNGLMTVSCAADGRVLVSNIEHNTCAQLFTHRGRAHRLSLIPNSPSSFYSCGEDGKCCFFDLRSLPSSANSGFSDTMSPRTGIDTIRENFKTFQDASITKTVFKNQSNRVSSVYCIHVNPLKPHELAVAGSSQVVAIYDARKFESPCFQLCPDHLINSTEHVTGVKFNCFGNVLLASYNDEDIYSMDTAAHSKPCDSTSNSMRTHFSESATANDSDSVQQMGDGNYIQKYEGHRNDKTVKQVAFYGPRSDWVVSGSDCGHIFIWSTKTGKLVKMLDADSIGATNCFDNHPYMPLLASSGLENDGKIWSPLGPRVRILDPSSVPTECSNTSESIPWHKCQSVMKRNLLNRGIRHRGDSSNGRMMLQLLQSYMMSNVASSDTDSDDAMMNTLISTLPNATRPSVSVLRAYDSLNEYTFALRDSHSDASDEDFSNSHNDSEDDESFSENFSDEDEVEVFEDENHDESDDDSDGMQSDDGNNEVASGYNSGSSDDSEYAGSSSDDSSEDTIRELNENVSTDISTPSPVTIDGSMDGSTTLIHTSID